MNWQPIKTAPKDGTNIIVGFDFASVWIIHAAWWDNAEWRDEADDVGWWSYTLGSVTQEKLEGARAPTHWIPLPPPP